VVSGDTAATARLSALLELVEAEREVLEIELNQLRRFAAMDDIEPDTLAPGEAMQCT
jgi:hypothetical protein